MLLYGEWTSTPLSTGEPTRERLFLLPGENRYNDGVYIEEGTEYFLATPVFWGIEENDVFFAVCIERTESGRNYTDLIDGVIRYTSAVQISDRSGIAFPHNHICVDGWEFYRWPVGRISQSELASDMKKRIAWLRRRAEKRLLRLH
jgi:hypothetical protein